MLKPRKGVLKMKKVMVMSVRATVDKKTNENVILTVYDLGNRNANGVIFSAKSGETVRVAFTNEPRNPEKYAKYKALNIGSLCTMGLGVNDFDSRVFVVNLDLVQDSPYIFDDIYGAFKL